MRLYSHPYSQAGRRTRAEADGSRRAEQVSGSHRRRPTAVLIFARHGSAACSFRGRRCREAHPSKSGRWPSRLRSRLVQRRVRTEPNPSAPVALILRGHISASAVGCQPLQILPAQPQRNAAKLRLAFRVGRLRRLWHAHDHRPAPSRSTRSAPSLQGLGGVPVPWPAVEECNGTCH